MELYRMPNGVIRQFNGNAPEGAVPVKKTVKVEKAVEEIEEKAVEEIKNKAVTPAKNKKGSKK
jgi:hypothetical protein